MRNKSKFIDNTGFGNNAANESRRLSNKDGSYNVRKIWIPFWQRYSILHTLHKMQTGQFILLVLFYYLLVNTFFACLYYFIGVDQLTGISPGSGWLHEFLQAFFFSAQTITTVGYGQVHPATNLTNLLAALESFTGILTFALITGLIYARFSQPRAYLRFSDHALISPHRGSQALMFRLASYKNNNLTNVTAQVILALHEKDHERPVTQFYNLTLEIGTINTLVSSWTIVHLIDQDSPMHGLTAHDLARQKAELIIQIQGMDDQLFNTVQQKTSYAASEIVFHARFIPIINRSGDGSNTLVDLSKLSNYELL